MNRRKFINSTTLGSLMFAAGKAYAAGNQKRPNIILLLTDDQYFRTLGCYGNPQVKTPNFDQLAADGYVFDRAYDTTSICMASRSQIMTGMYEYKTGCNFQHGPLTVDKWEKSYPILLREAGYYSSFVGKFGFAVKPTADGTSNYHTNADMPMDSFDEWFGWPGQGSYHTEENEFVASYAKKYPHVTRAVGAVSQDFIKRAAKQNQPFCLSVSFKASHSPLSPDPFFDDVYADTVWETLPNYDAAGAAHIPQQAKCGRQFLNIKDFRPDKYQVSMRKYNQLVYGIDYAVGMIREELKRQGVADNTVILYLTDNGYSCGAHGMGGKVLPYEEPSRSPMIIFDPRRPGGKRVKGLAANIDMAPTILDLAGLPIPENMDGKSLLPLLDNPNNGRVHDSILLINAWGSAPTHSLAVVTEEYKYIYWPYSHKMEAAEELYNLNNDPYEMNNLAVNPEYQDVLKRIQKHYDQMLSFWKNSCVKEGNYPVFGKIYDRHISWEEKLAAMDKRLQRNYLEWDKEVTKKKASRKKKETKATARAKRKAK